MSFPLDPYDSWKARRRKILVSLPGFFKNRASRNFYCVPKILPPDFFFHGERIRFELRSFFIGNAVFVLTNRRIITRQGWFNPLYTECDLEKIKKVKVRPFLFLKMFGALEFQWDDTGARQMVWAYVRNPEGVMSLVMKGIKEKGFQNQAEHEISPGTRGNLFRSS